MNKKQLLSITFFADFLKYPTVCRIFTDFFRETLILTGIYVLSGLSYFTVHTTISIKTKGILHHSYPLSFIIKYNGV